MARPMVRDKTCLLTLALSAALATGCSQTPAENPAAKEPQLMSSTPISVEFGRLHSCAKTRQKIQLYNSTGQSIEIAEVTTSCDCLTVIVDDRVVPSGARANLRLELDLAKEPNFRGTLQIEAKGLLADGKAAFIILANVDVADTQR